MICRVCNGTAVRLVAPNVWRLCTACIDVPVRPDAGEMDAAAAEQLEALWRDEGGES